MTAWLIVALVALWGGAYLILTPRGTPHIEWRPRTHVRTIPRPYDWKKETS